MNFFTAQDKARRNTTRLIILFTLAVIALVVLTNILIIGAFVYMGTDETSSFWQLVQQRADAKTVSMISLGVLLLILLGSLYKILLLSKGGSVIAEMLGGTMVPRSTTDAEERRLLNIVEEMAIAAGMPVPRVYVLRDNSINAFAAGKSHNTAVIGVTRGAITLLNRDELQGVIAHEFSHILNGDMRLNLRLLGVLNGILLIGIIGEYILRTLRIRTSGRKDSAGAIVLIGIGLLVIGYAGTFFGKWIKASVSRQREYLADASAVQFTRNKDSIAGALKKIGGLDDGSLLESPSASEYSHAYFAEGVTEFMQSMFATHPPLDKRIRQIDPSWDGQYILPELHKLTEEEDKKEPEKPNPFLAMGGAAAAIIATSEQLIEQIGTVSEESIEYAREMLAAIPEKLRAAAENPWSARAVIYTLLLTEQKDQQQAWLLLEQYADKDMPELSRELYSLSRDMDESLVIPLMELSVNAMRELSEPQYQKFRLTLDKIITADRKVDLAEWVIQRMVIQQLDEHFGLRKSARPTHAYLGAVKDAAETVFSLLAHIEHGEDLTLAKNAFERGKKVIGAGAFNFLPREDLTLDRLNSAVDELMKLKPLLKPRILKGCAAIILADGETTRRGVEIFRTIAINMDCPAPPLPAAI